MLDSGEADVLFVSKLDRLSRSVVDFAQLLKAAKRPGWAVVCLSPDVDTTSANGSSARAFSCKSRNGKPK